MPTADAPITIYTPTSELAQPRKLVAHIFCQLWRGRELAWRLFLRDTAALYRQSILGYIWAFLPPIATTGTFVFLSHQQIITVGPTPVAYTAYVMIGTVLWQSFVDALNSPLKMLSANKSLLIRVNFPRESLLVAGLLEVILNLGIRLLLLVPVFWFFHIPVTVTILLFPIGLAALIVLGLAIGLIITPIGLLYTDIGRGITIVTAFWLFLTPVVYPPPQVGLAKTLVTFNPVSPLILTAKDWILSQPAMHLGAFGAITLAALAVLLVGLLVYHIALPHLIERMGG